MKNRIILFKLNSEKGLTGVDIVVGTSIIIITIVVVTMIAMNIDLGGKSINRTAGATRIATTMIEQIEKMYYDEIGEIELTTPDVSEPSGELKNIKDIIDDLTDATNSRYDVINTDIGEIPERTVGNSIVIDGREVQPTDMFFGVKIPRGYRVEITVTDIHRDGSIDTMSTDPIPRFNLLKEITVNVVYMVGNNERNVSVTMVKNRESVKDCNEPDLNSLSRSISVDISDIVPVKYNPSSDKYEITTQTDTEWYSYSSGEWARVIRTDSDSASNILMNITDIQNNMYVWIPRYSRIGSKIEFLYKNTNHIIEELEDMDTGYMIKATGDFRKLNLRLNRVGNNTTGTLPPSFTNGEKGEWVRVTALGGSVAEHLNGTEPYGPVKLHLD